MDTDGGAGDIRDLNLACAHSEGPGGQYTRKSRRF